MHMINSIEQGPSWEASQEIPCFSWNQNVNFQVHVSLPLVPVLSQMNRVYTFPPHSSKV